MSFWHASVAVQEAVGAGHFAHTIFDYVASSRSAEALDEQRMETWGRINDILPKADPPADSLPPDMLTGKHHYIVERVLKQFEARRSHTEPISPLRMIIYGGPGTGKTRLIQTLTELSDPRKVLKLSPTKHTASRIGGFTFESYLRLATRPTLDFSSSFGIRLQTQLANKNLIVIDDISMVTKITFGLISDRITSVCAQLGLCSPTDTFGGLDVLLCGDFHQSPPSHAPSYQRLYDPTSMLDEGPGSRNVQGRVHGRRIFASFEDIVVLDQRVTPITVEWQGLLNNLRTGTDLDNTYTRLNQETSLHAPGFDSAEWQDVPLITNHFMTRQLWNLRALRDLSARRTKQIYTWHSSITVDDESEGAQRLAVLADHKNRARIMIPTTISLCEGARVAVTPNASKISDPSTGILGTVVRIVLGKDETSLPCEDQEVVLSTLPFYILIQIDPRHGISIPGLPPNVIPITPHVFDYGQALHLTERQFPLTLAFAVSTFRVHGQTVAKAFLDLAETPSGSLGSSFAQYDTLTRFEDLTAFRLVRPLDIKAFKEPVPQEVLAEDARFEGHSLQLINR